MDKKILIKYFNNSCSNEEFEQIVGWAQKKSLEKEDKDWNFEFWENFEPDPNKKNNRKYGELLNKIHHEINLKHWVNESNTKTVFSRGVKWLSRVAAVLFLPMLGIIFYLLLNINYQFENTAGLTVDSLEVIAPIGSRTVVQLSDGTTVHLNYGSKLKYPQKFRGDTREITLIGEGYFDIAHNPDKPFIVKTGKLDIKAVGTEFNVQAYPDDKIIATSLAEGKVIIEKPISNDKTIQVGSMIPGQHVEYNTESGKIISSIGNINKYIAWKDGKLVFDNQPITEVAERLERMFNVEIELAENVKYLTYTVTFFNDPLYLILDLMKATTPIKYEILPRKRQADGSFSKQKIKILHN